MSAVTTTIEAASQQFVDRDTTHPAIDISVELKKQLSNHYIETGMVEQQPAKAKFLTERGHRSAAWAGLWHVITSQLIRTSLQIY